MDSSSSFSNRTFESCSILFLKLYSLGWEHINRIDIVADSFFIFKKVMTQEPINFDDVFTKGASATKLPFNVTALLSAITSQFNWQPDPEKIYKSVAKEFRPEESDIMPDVVDKDHVQEARYVNDRILENLSPEIKFALSQILLSPAMNSMKASHDFKVTFADIWDGSEGCPWHCDAIEGGTFLFLVYLTDHEEWDPALGGQLEFGKIAPRLDDNYFIDYQGRADEIESFGKVEPSNGTFVVVNNHNQFMTHRCFKLANPNEKRITITMGFDLSVKDDFTSPASVLWGDGERVTEGRSGLTKA